MNHLTEHELQECLDHAGEAEAQHLRGCAACRERLSAFQRVEDVLRRVPAERAPGNFTNVVLKRLRISESTSFSWSFFKNLAPGIALVLVFGVIVIALQMSGALSGTQVGESAQLTKNIYGNVSGGVATGVTAFNSWVRTYLSFAFANSSYGITMFLIIFFSAIALIDKFILMPHLRRRTMNVRHSAPS